MYCTMLVCPANQAQLRPHHALWVLCSGQSLQCAYFLGSRAPVRLPRLQRLRSFSVITWSPREQRTVDIEDDRARVPCLEYDKRLDDPLELPVHDLERPWHLLECKGVGGHARRIDPPHRQQPL